MIKEVKKYKSKISKRSKLHLKNVIIENSKIDSVFVLNIGFSKNNIRVDVANFAGDILFWTTSGLCGFSSRKKTTSFALKKITSKLIEFLTKYGIVKLSVRMHNITPNCEEMLDVIVKSGVYLTNIKIVNPIKFNGVRVRGVRRT